MSKHPSPQPVSGQELAPPAGPAARVQPVAHHRWRSAELFGSQQEVEIEHGQTIYRLRRTSLGKLILTK